MLNSSSRRRRRRREGEEECLDAQCSVPGNQSLDVRSDEEATPTPKGEVHSTSTLGLGGRLGIREDAPQNFSTSNLTVQGI